MFADVHLAQLELRASEPSQVCEVADIASYFTVYIWFDHPPPQTHLINPSCHHYHSLSRCQTSLSTSGLTIHPPKRTSSILRVIITTVSLVAKVSCDTQT
ncbi:hypothetical protein DPX16_17812 [Anabarilius grahami]|uniref:Uncharacterized protein n=1 Tax=Anabarilius grahami TaxID=495550 RepID=A0A3N0YHF9_ANAGA|nr:hypothetical protein DPX16_17812 [Anabarilius grahami]